MLRQVRVPQGERKLKKNAVYNLLITMTKRFDNYLGLCLFAGGITRFPSVDVVLPLEDLRDGVFDGAGPFKGQEVFAVPEYVCLPATITD